MSDQTDPDFLLRDLLATMRSNRDVLIEQMAERHRVDGVSDFSLTRLLVIVDAGISAIEKAGGYE